MKSPFLRLRPCLAAIALFTAALPALAQVPISGNVYDGNGGPLLAGTVYHATTSITVPAGQTLTIQPGAIIKNVSFATQWVISGTLNSNGTAGNPVIFTDIRDDTAGGDTNGDGAASVPTAGWWRSLFVYGGTTGTLTYTQLRYNGQGGYGAVDVQAGNAALTLNNCTIRDCAAAGIQFNGSAAPIVVSNCTFTNNSGVAIDNVQLSRVSSLTNNTASGPGGNYVRVSSTTLATDTTINANNIINGALMSDGSTTINTGVTLTLNQGVVIKALVFGQQWIVSGKLVCNGASGNPVVFTDYRDDTAGGDTNGDAAGSAPVNGHWRALFFYNGSATSSLNFTQVRYGGQGGYGMIDIQNAVAISLSNCTLRNGLNSGVQFNTIASGTTIASCNFQNNTGYAIDGANINDVDQFTNNTASGNGGNYARVTTANVAANMTINANNCMGGALVTTANPDVPGGMTLTLNAGVVFKMATFGNQWTIHGVLLSNGSSGNPVVFTDLRDDTAGGDTNGDANASAPAASFWRGLFFYSAASGSTLNYTEVRYGGQGGYGGLDFQNSCAVTVTNSKVRYCGSSPGIQMNGNPAPVSISGCQLTNNGVAIESVPITIVPNFTNNTASSNGGNYIRVSNGTVSSNTTINANNCLGGALVINANVDVNIGTTLTFNAGAVVKWQTFGTQMVVNGALVSHGVAGNNVVFTAYQDDTAGGDTNNDGNATAATPGWWRAFFINGTSVGTAIDYSELRYNGQGGYAAVQFQGAATISMNTTRIRYSASRGVDLQSTASPIQMRRCSIENCAGIAIDNVLFENVPGFIANQAFGNGGNYIRVTNSTITSDITVGAEQCMGGALVIATNITVPTGTTLNFEPGVVLKFALFGAQVVANGGLVARGSITQPVVFTEFRDDGYGGDTNADGAASVPTKGWWRGLFLYSTPQTSRIEDARVRYTGQGGYAGVTTNNSGLSTLNNVRAEHASNAGFELSSLASEAHGLSAWDCDGNGINLLAGPFNVRQASCVACGTGLRKSSALWTGVVRDSIAWANTTNYVGFAPADVAFSDGLAGGVGNINADPLFASLANGDLHLTLGSPCINTGDPASPLDPNCTQADMGAYPGDNGNAPFTYCTGKINSAGCIPAVVFNGNASMTNPAPFEIRVIDALNNKTGLFFYGFNGQLAGPFQGGFKCVADPVKRLPLISSGGSPTGSDCTGVFSFDLKALIQGMTDAQLVPGATVDIQCWYRDPAVFTTTGLSNGGQFRVCN